MNPSNVWTDREAAAPRLGPLPYLFFGAIWFGLAHLAAMYKTIEPIYLWILTQSLLLEKVSTYSRWSTQLIWLAAYAALALIAWWALEKPGAERSRWWTRGAIAWLAIQVAYSVIAALLVWFGVLYE